ncbi:hypothetical protein [Amphibacillus sediminis]|uniref:hypothetical protein n=1 Tax=Amphibacillus sediminis TaxID=360185 RepID=UPI000829F472|nr:hypothetical protein [Amphibacillus sediminis]
MSTNRQDAWTLEEDQLLADTVLGYIKSGRTQLESFKDVAKQLNRTPAACGFRWNATIRKLHEDAIEQAKKERKKLNQPATQLNQINHDAFTLEQAIQWLEKVKGELIEDGRDKKTLLYDKIVKENERLNDELIIYQKLFDQIASLMNEVKQFQ